MLSNRPDAARGVAGRDHAQRRVAEAREAGRPGDPGFEADLLIVDGSPLENPRVLLDPLLVVSNGRVALDRMTFGK